MEISGEPQEGGNFLTQRIREGKGGQIKKGKKCKWGKNSVGKGREMHFCALQKKKKKNGRK